MLAHIVALILLAIPDAAGPGLRRSAWKNPTVQNELGAWAHRLRAAGWEISKEELEARMWVVAKTWTAWMVAVRAPLQPYTEYAGVRQRWRMFVAPHRHPAKLVIDVESDGQWTPIYTSRSPDLDWDHWTMDHTRMRSMLFRYAWKEYRRFYRSYARWVARRVFEDFPEASRVRVRWYGFRTPTPEEVREDRVPPGRYRQPQIFAREDVQ